MLTLLLHAALIILIYMTLVWIFSVLKRDMSIVDAGWGPGFIIVTLFYICRLGAGAEIRHFIIAYLITLWGMRLAIHITIRNWKKDEDPRYQAFRKNWGNSTWWKSYYKVFLLQGALMLVILLPVLTIILNVGDTLYVTDSIGVIIWLAGFFFESFADYQLLRFKKNPANKGKVMQYGLWKYSRHPNYFGETLIWWGIFIISVGAGNWYISILSPLLITFLLLKVSGVAMTEKRYDGNDKYAEYKKRTSAFIPLPPKK